MATFNAVLAAAIRRVREMRSELGDLLDKLETLKQGPSRRAASDPPPVSRRRVKDEEEQEGDDDDDE